MSHISMTNLKVIPKAGSIVPTRKGSGGCCCGPCHVWIGCSQSIGQGVDNECCSCVPKRACFKVILEEEGYDDETITVVLIEFDCDQNAYTASISLGGTNNVDLSVSFLRIVDEYGESKCWAVFESVALGYTIDEYYIDTRKFIEMGTGAGSSPYSECGYLPSVSSLKNECLNLGFTFEDIDFGEYIGSGRISLTSRGDIALPVWFTGAWGCDEYGVLEECSFTRICVRYRDDYTDETKYACLIESYYGEDSYSVTLNGIDFVIYVEADDPKTLRLEPEYPYAVYGEDSVQAQCPFMIAEWTLTNGATISVQGDRWAGCSDCRCFCPCLCVTYQNNYDDEVYIGEVCWDEDYGGFSGTLSTIVVGPGEYAETREINFQLVCNECTGVTMITVDGERPMTVECPDIEAFWSFFEEDGSITTISAVCKNCLETCGGNFTLSIPCCPYRTEWPEFLYATFSSAPADPIEPGNDSCVGATGTVVLRFVGNTGGSGFVPEWHGTGSPLEGCPEVNVRVELSCGEYNEWKLDIIADPPATASIDEVISCDPLMLVFFGSGFSDECCDADGLGTDQGNFYVTITE